MARLFSDGASGVLASNISNSDTTITLSAGQGANFPTPTGSDYAILTLEDVSGNKEKIQLDDRVGDVLTVTRGAESTTPLAFSAGDRCELRMTASAIALMLQTGNQTISDTWQFDADLRMGNGVALVGEVAATGSFKDLIQLDGNDAVQVGDGTVAVNFNGSAVTFGVEPTAPGYIADSGGATAAVALSPPSGTTIDVDAVVGSWKRGTVILDDAVILGGAGFKGSAGNVSESFHIGWGTNWDTNGLAIYDDGNITIDGNTMWHAGNDGGNSTLDADLLDGEEGTYYAGLNNGLTTQDPDAAVDPNIYTNHANTPDAGASYWHIITTFYQNVSASADRSQIAVQATGTGAALWTRKYTGAAWSAWARAGSGTVTRPTKVWDQKSAGTDGGTFTSGSWQTRDLNQIDDPDGIVSTLTANQISLPAGTYFVRASAPGASVQWHKTRLYDVTGAATLLVGTPEYSTGSGTNQTRSELVGRFTLGVSSLVELQHRCDSSESSVGLGRAAGWSEVETYAQLEIVKEVD